MPLPRVRPEFTRPYEADTCHRHSPVISSTPGFSPFLKAVMGKQAILS